MSEYYFIGTFYSALYDVNKTNVLSGVCSIFYLYNVIFFCWTSSFLDKMWFRSWNFIVIYWFLRSIFYLNSVQISVDFTVLVYSIFCGSILILVSSSNQYFLCFCKLYPDVCIWIIRIRRHIKFIYIVLIWDFKIIIS